jgi:hypothetical protein
MPDTALFIAACCVAMALGACLGSWYTIHRCASLTAPLLDMAADCECGEGER